jgi:hypothetical protein
MTSQGRKRNKNQLNFTVSPGASAPENIYDHTHTRLFQSGWYTEIFGYEYRAVHILWGPKLARYY